MTKSIADRFRELLVDQLGIHPEIILPSSTISDDLGADSLDIVDLTLAVEDEFRIGVLEEDLERLSTVQEAITYIEEQLAAH